MSDELGWRIAAGMVIAFAMFYLWVMGRGASKIANHAHFRGMAQREWMRLYVEKHPDPYGESHRIVMEAIRKHNASLPPWAERMSETDPREYIVN